MNTTLLVLHRLAEQYRSALAKEFPQVTVLAAASREAAGPLAADAQVIIALDSQFDDALLRAAPGLRWIQALSTGTDVINRLGALDRKRVLVTTMRGIHGPQMSEMALLQMLALSRGLPGMLRNQREHRWVRWEQPLLWRKTVAVVGVGVIAQDMARCFKTFGMTVLGVSRSERKVEHFDRVFPRTLLNEAAAQADFLLVLAPYSTETERMIDASVLAAMKRSAFLINLARGGVVDEEALVDALARGAIAGAGLDVFASEPLPPDHPLWSMENVIITPRLGGMSDVYVEQCLPVLYRNVRAFLAGDTEAMLNRN